MVTKVAAGTWALDLGLWPPLASAAYLVDGRALPGDDDAVTLVDAGLRWNRPSIRDELAAVDVEPADLDRVVLTHYDLDHVGGLAALLPAFDGPVYLGGPDHDLATGGADPPLTHPKGLFHRAARRLFPLPTELDLRPVADGDRIGAFAVYLTPGHNPGHAVSVHDGGVAFLGDLVWEDEGELTRPFWLDSYDLDALAASIADVADRSDPFDVAAIAHGTPVTTDGHAALRRLADRH